MLGFSSLADLPGLRHAITTRQGGASEGPFASLNLGYHVGDDAARVSSNRSQLAASLGYEAGRLVAAQQVHGTRAHLAGSSESGHGAFDWAGAIGGTDALIVAESHCPVLILVADCAPLLLVDPRRHVLAVVHAGWRGAVGGVASAAAAAMSEYLGSRPQDLHAGVGPCLCPACCEVGSEVAAAAGAVTAAAVHSGGGPAPPHLDLRALLHHDLCRAGVPSERIETLPDCPRCRLETFFSHRGQGGTAGRFGLVAWWD